MFRDKINWLRPKGPVLLFKTMPVSDLILGEDEITRLKCDQFGTARQKVIPHEEEYFV